MDIRQLRYFQAIYENGSLLAASRRVNVATTALSYHLGRLEDEVSARLFERTPRGLTPTAAGERLHDHATAILRAIDVALADLRQGGKEISGSVRVGMAYSAVRAIGVPLARKLLTEHPKVQLSLNESLSGATLTSLLRGEVDVALVYNPPADDRIKNRPLLVERMACVGREDLIGPPGVPITVDEMMTLPIIVLQQGVASGMVMNEQDQLKRIESRAVLTMNSIQAISGALRERLGCTIATKLSVSGAVADGTLSYRPIVSPGLSRELHLCEPSGAPQTYVLETIKAMLITLIVEAVGKGVWEAELVDP